ncbi:MAG: lipoyl synthase [candidate division Zixibacteria bacterium]|jgi:lipoic acid synthetase|nr:lipoyl synthase [candidate division Zixibacteria bacterium]
MMDDNNPVDNLRKPPWLKVKANFGPVYTEVKTLLRQLNLHTVCQEASCPNIGECFSARTATFIILGDRCTRNCRFCDVNSGKPSTVDCDEPARVAEAVRKLNLKFAVITSVTRDDLSDGGAAIFAETIDRINRLGSGCLVEVLIPDLQGNRQSLDTIIAARPRVLAHNIETVPELYDTVRPEADYRRSLELLRYVSEKGNGIIVKSGIMVGLGETLEQIERVLENAAGAGCEIFTIGQYLAPSKKHLPVRKFYTPDEFEELKNMGEKIGITHVESGPLVRSSYMAHRQSENFEAKRIR